MQPGGKSTLSYVRFTLLGFCYFLIMSQDLYASDMCNRPVWQDEFTGSVLDKNKWRVIEGDGCDSNLCGWGNNEKQWYSEDNIHLEDGMLFITARSQDERSSTITSGRITTQGRFSQQYGRFEARMKLPMVLGTWPAFWMMPEHRTKPWPLEGEIDILEQGGKNRKDFRRILGSIHFGKTWPDNTDYSEALLVPYNWGEEFHTYRVDWLPNLVRWSVDDKVFGEATPADINKHKWIFNDQPFNLILNLAVGGTLGGNVDSNFSSAELVIDFVRVYNICNREG